MRLLNHRLVCALPPISTQSPCFLPVSVSHIIIITSLTSAYTQTTHLAHLPRHHQNQHTHVRTHARTHTHTHTHTPKINMFKTFHEWLYNFCDLLLYPLKYILQNQNFTLVWIFIVKHLSTIASRYENTHASSQTDLQRHLLDSVYYVVTWILIWRFSAIHNNNVFC